jgi:exopolysaccharide biosynthesis polyprenyl glycosylphosphotransferase
LKTFDRFLKRVFDIIVSSVILLIISPLLIACAVAVKLTSKGPVFFLQERIGEGGKPFTIYKFRTMETDAEKKGLGYLVTKEDSRITKVGQFLRRWSIDEFPQLFNVLRGEMSLVGPRPTLGYQVEQYDNFQRRRLEMPPGMTGLATVKGRNLLSWNERIEYDVWYVDNYTFWLDIKIILATFGTILSGSGVYADNLKVFEIKPSGKAETNNEDQGTEQRKTPENAPYDGADKEAGGDPE